MNNKLVAAAFLKKQPAKGSNFYSPDGIILYSYGRHFKVAEWQDETLVENTRRYSASTSRHQFHFRNAACRAGVETVKEEI